MNRTLLVAIAIAFVNAPVSTIAQDRDWDVALPATHRIDYRDRWRSHVEDAKAELVAGLINGTSEGFSQGCDNAVRIVGSVKKSMSHLDEECRRGGPSFSRPLQDYVQIISMVYEAKDSHKWVPMLSMVLLLADGRCGSVACAGAWLQTQGF